MDPIANMLIQIKNGQMVGKESVVFPHSKIKMEIAKVLEKNGFIKSVEKKGKDIKTMEIVLAYDESGKPKITCAKKVSKSSQRVYSACDQIRLSKRGFGLKILTTPKGILTDKDAKKEKVGGEVLCEVW